MCMKHPLARASHAPWRGGPGDEQLMAAAAESDGQHSEEERDTPKLELMCTSKFENFDPKTYTNPAENQWGLCCRDGEHKKRTRKQVKGLQRDR